MYLRGTGLNSTMLHNSRKPLHPCKSRDSLQKREKADGKKFLGHFVFYFPEAGVINQWQLLSIALSFKELLQKLRPDPGFYGQSRRKAKSFFHISGQQLTKKKQPIQTWLVSAEELISRA